MSTRNDTAKRRAIVRHHYGLSRVVTESELAAETRNLQRRANAGTLDDGQAALAAALDITAERESS